MNNIDLIRNVKKYKPSEVCRILNICYKTLYRYDKANIFNKRYKQKKSVSPMIIKYSLDKSILKDYKGLIFDSPDDKWKEYGADW